LESSKNTLSGASENHWRITNAKEETKFSGIFLWVDIKTLTDPTLEVQGV
jgi:hypothetical protein